MEIRLIINGNLVHTIAMPNLSLITSKQDIFFATTAPEFLPGRCERIRLDSKPADKDEPVANSLQSSSRHQSNPQSMSNFGDTRVSTFFWLLQISILQHSFLFFSQIATATGSRSGFTRYRCKLYPGPVCRLAIKDGVPVQRNRKSSRRRRRATRVSWQSSLTGRWADPAAVVRLLHRRIWCRHDWGNKTESCRHRVQGFRVGL